MGHFSQAPLARSGRNIYVIYLDIYYGSVYWTGSSVRASIAMNWRQTSSGV